MTEASFTPTLFMKEGCPFCLKVRLFLLEAGQLDHVHLREFAVGSEDEKAIRAELEPHIAKLSFPAAKISPREHITESDAIIAHFAGVAGADPAKMPTLRAYAEGLMPKMMALHRENSELKKQLA